MTRLDRAAARYAAAVGRQAAARDTLAGEVRAAIAAGMSEVETARRAGVTRSTIRKWVGKDTGKDTP